jgi:hypothetical protein
MTDASADPIDRLLDAIDLIKVDQREAAIPILRQLIREDSDFEAAWLWMAVAVESLDHSAVCLDNVLRINPRNTAAAGALYRIRSPEIELEKRRGKLRIWRDAALGGMWFLVVLLLYMLLITFFVSWI